VGNAILGESDPDPAPGVAVQKDDSGLFEGWLELFMFPNGRHDDQVDSISQALAHEMSECIWNERNLAGFARFTSAFGGW